MDKSKAKCVAVIQCSVAHERCAGVACAGSFAQRKGYFAGYAPAALPIGVPASGAADGVASSTPGEAYYVPFGCGGCPGRRVGRLLANVKRQIKRLHGVEPDEIIVHLATCIVGDNGHYTPCPFVKDIKTMIARKGLHFVEGSLHSRDPGAMKKQEAGVYAPLPPLDNFT